MVLNSIGIDNFRCFRHLDEVKLTPGVNLFIGDNASGKTSLLMACKYVANCFFSGFSDRYTSWKTPGVKEFHKNLSGEKKLDRLPVNIRFSVDYRNAACLLGTQDTQHQTLYKKNQKNSRPRIRELSDVRQYSKSVSESFLIEHGEGLLEQRLALPVIVSFSTQDIHSNQKIDSKAFTEYEQSPTFGYYHCSSTDGLLKYWVRRMLILKEAGRNPDELSAVISALTRMFGDEGCGVISEFDVRVNLKDIVCVFKDGREIPSSMLSDGYKRLFSIVIDIAFRCALLNSLIFGRSASARSHGVAIIDEIDLHLHPSLQLKVLDSLHRTFPNIQFIVSSHAPMVMTGVDSSDINSVKYMKYDKDSKMYFVENVNTFGMDISSIAESILNVPRREPSVALKLKQLEDFIDSGDMTKAKVALAEMKAGFGERIPELSGLETEIFINENL